MTDDTTRHIPPVCPDCERAVGVDTGVTPDGECSWCGAQLVYVRRDVLIELVAEWRCREDLHHEFAYNDCADDLEAVIADD